LGCLKLTYQNNTELKIISNKKELTLNKSDNKGYSSYLFGFNGKEMEDGIGDGYDFGARIYDARLGRWLAVDPLQMKYPELSSYNFVANSPLLFIDPDGKKIKIPKTANRKAILKMINSKALGLYAINEEGYLFIKRKSGDEEKYSKYYQGQLVKAMTSEKTITIHIAQEYTLSFEEGNASEIFDVDKSNGGGVTIPDEPGEDNTVVISGNPNLTINDQEEKDLDYQAADILQHELLGHAIPILIEEEDTGNAVDNENKARKEQKIPLRSREEDHPEYSVNEEPTSVEKNKK